MTNRKGAGRGTGKGYKNLRSFPKDSSIHSDSAKGRKQPQTIPRIPKMKAKPQIGDGKSPNIYWVSFSNDFYICKKGVCDWASDSKKFKVKSETIKKPFNTFEEAQNYIEQNLFVSDIPKEDEVNLISIEDRYSGQVWEQGIHAYQKKSGGIMKSKGWDFEIETSEDTNFTKEEMEKRGETFR